MIDYLEIPGVTHFYRGKVRDVYFFESGKVAMIATDRISAFDVILPRSIPYKGAVLNGIATYFLEASKHLVPNWYICSPLPFVSVGYAAEPIKIEMVVRGYLAGHAWRIYNAGIRELCGIRLPEGLKENDKLPEPIITPTTKESAGVHDQDISVNEILDKGLVTETEWNTLVEYAIKLFMHGSKLAAERGLILADTKYEFGKDKDGNILLIDEIHTPDSSRYFYLNEYEERQSKGLPQQQLSKEFVRQWLIEEGFTGAVGESVPEMTDEKVNEISERYILIYELITGKKFNKFTYPDQDEIVQKILSSL